MNLSIYNNDYPIFICKTHIYAVSHKNAMMKGSIVSNPNNRSKINSRIFKNHKTPISIIKKQNILINFKKDVEKILYIKRIKDFIAVMNSRKKIRLRKYRPISKLKTNCN